MMSSISDVSRVLLGYDSLHHSLFSELLPFSGPMNKILMTCNMIYGVVKSRRTLKHVYNDSDNFRKLLAGCTLNLISGDKLVIVVIARVVLVAERWMTLMEKQNALAQRYRRCGQSFRGKATNSGEENIDPLADDLLGKRQVSASASWCMMNMVSQAADYVKISTCSTGSLSVEMFNYSIALCDLIEAISMRNEITSASVNEFFLNTMSLAQHLVENHDLLVRQFRTHEGTMEKIFKALGFTDPKNTVTLMRDNLASALHITAETIKTAKRVGETGLEVVTSDFFKHGAYTLTIGVTGRQVECLLPSTTEPTAPT